MSVLSFPVLESQECKGDRHLLAIALDLVRLIRAGKVNSLVYVTVDGSEGAILSRWYTADGDMREAVLAVTALQHDLLNARGDDN